MTKKLKGQQTRRLLTIVATGLCVAAFLPCTSIPASAGLLDFLFGPRQPTPAYAPISRPPVPLAIAPVRARHKIMVEAEPRSNYFRPKITNVVRWTNIAKHAPSPIARITAHPALLPGPLGPFLLDPTLRRGDVVVTSEGLKVFTGASGSQHSDSEFAALSRSTQFVAGKGSILSAIERANKFSEQPLVEVRLETATPRPEKQTALNAH